MPSFNRVVDLGMVMVRQCVATFNFQMTNRYVSRTNRYVSRTNRYVSRTNRYFAITNRYCVMTNL
jgi:hypothetical protein